MSTKTSLLVARVNQHYSTYKFEFLFRCENKNHLQLISAKESVSSLIKDQLIQQPPEWFQVIVYLEIFIHLPFAFVAVYAFGKGFNCNAFKIQFFTINNLTFLIHHL